MKKLLYIIIILKMGALGAMDHHVKDMLLTMECKGSGSTSTSIRPLYKAKQIAANKNWPETYECSKIALYKGSTQNGRFEWTLSDFTGSTAKFLLIALGKLKLPPASHLNLALGFLKNSDNVDNAQKEAYRRIRYALRSDLPLELDTCRVDDLHKELQKLADNGHAAPNERMRALLYGAMLTVHTSKDHAQIKKVSWVFTDSNFNVEKTERRLVKRTRELLEEKAPLLEPS